MGMPVYMLTFVTSFHTDCLSLSKLAIITNKGMMTTQWCIVTCHLVQSRTFTVIPLQAVHYQMYPISHRRIGTCNFYIRFRHPDQIIQYHMLPSFANSSILAPSISLTITISVNQVDFRNYKMLSTLSQHNIQLYVVVFQNRKKRN